ncbi:MAG: hypothetical protein KDB61_03135, partial [Planctomycetes bacterium]|nr:hypothetical protein [Planctomycetota bacterium]
VVDETRDAWRKDLRGRFAPLVNDCKTIREAAAIVAAQIAGNTGVSYNTKREKACQSPAESIRQGMASCTGLSILMVDALRSVGVPARLAGIALWGTKEGNHTWIEVFDGESWKNADYAEGPDGWDRGWEVDRCAYSDPLNPIHGVFATSYRPTGIGFPRVWNWTGAGENDALATYFEQERNEQGALTKLDWTWQEDETPAVDRTEHYMELAGGRRFPVPEDKACVIVRAFLADSDTRVDLPVRIQRGDEILAEGRTACESQDRNDFIRVECDGGDFHAEYQLADGTWKRIEGSAEIGKETAIRIDVSESDATGILTLAQRSELATWFRSAGATWPERTDWPELVDAEAVNQASAELWAILKEAGRSKLSSRELGPLPPTIPELMQRMTETGRGVVPGSLTLGEHQMPFVLLRKESTPAPTTGRPLYICMHGGGRNPDVPGPHAWDVNSREWQTQVVLAAELYHGEGIFFVPRMADDRLGRWYHANVQEAVDALVEHGLRAWNVDPNRVYIMGISEGAYGTQHLGPFMADRFGGANAMAGGVGKDVPAENLRNLAFRSDVGEHDTMYDRVNLSREFHARMEEAKALHGGYVNHLEVQMGKGHGVDYEHGSEWMIQHHRDPRPDTVIWTSKVLDGHRRAAFYWLGLEIDDRKGPISMTAKLLKDENRIEITAVSGKEGFSLEGVTLRIYLDDAMVDFTQPVMVTLNGETAFQGNPTRSVETLAKSLALRGDPSYAFPAQIDMPLHDPSETQSDR